MSEQTVNPSAPRTGFWTRLLRTPLSDLLRGRLTGANVATAVAAAGLPEPLSALVATVVRRSRLWRGEQFDVARELAGHFRDGLDAGATPEHLLARFGDPQQAATMIRRARIRCRPWAWHVFRWTVRGACVLLGLFVLFYLALTARYLWAKPTISRNHVAELNAALQAPAGQRAWPLYRAALLQLDWSDKQRTDAWWTDPKFAISPDDPAWKDLQAFVATNQGSLDLARQAADKPRLGFAYGDPEDREFLQKTSHRDSILPAPGDSLVSLLLPHHQELRKLSFLLTADFRRAAAEGDREAAAADLRALAAMAEHHRADAIAIEDLIAIAVFRSALDLTADMLHDAPALLSDEQLVELAHRLSAFAGGGTIRVQFDGERRMIDDILQRAFTDDGAGDGHLTADGMKMFLEFSSFSGRIDGAARANSPAEELIPFLGPGMTVAVGGRRELHDLAMRLIDQSEAERRGPMHAWPPSTMDDELRRLRSSIGSRIRHAPVLLIIPAVSAIAVAGERITQERDGVLTAIALELYRRRHGDWPATLDALVPRYLPAPPLDRFTGQPLRYRLKDGAPVVYSCGVDKQDDGGNAPRGPGAREDFQGFVLTRPVPNLAPGSGFDWILFPPERRPAPEAGKSGD